MCTRRSVSARVMLAAWATVAGSTWASSARADDVSAPVILQDFESTWQSVTSKMPDVFAAGYGGIYTPPPGRAESGNQSVGYDVYDRFDLGSAGNPTLYGTAAGLKQLVSAIHRTGGNSYVDLVWNHDGFADGGTSGFAAAGGYPGFALTLQTGNSSSPGYNTQGYNAVDGDFHSAYATGDQQERLAGLVDIAQETNNAFVRQPTVAGPDNIPGPVPGAAPADNHPLANVPSASNAQYYPDRSGTPQTLTDPALGGQTFTRYAFNTTNTSAGTPVVENAQGYLDRYAQYVIQVIGADGFRVDAAKNMPTSVLNYLDLATYDASNRFLLNGQRQSVFSWSEVFDSNPGLLQSYVNKSATGTDAGNNGTVGGNRDVYDFPLYFAMQANLTGTTANNDWHNVVGASIDANDDGKLNGSQGVKFVQSQDSGGPALSNVAYAYTLLQPGNALVYYNGHNFGTEGQRSFPQDGREDALGGVYGNAITTLVDLRNRFGRGNYATDYLSTNELAFERAGSSLTLLSNRADAGFDSRTVDVSFAPGTPLLEYTGNAHGAGADPNGDIPQLLVVNADRSSPTGASVNVRFLRNSTFVKGTSTFTGNGDLVYGLPTPTGTLKLTGTAGTFGGNVPSASDANVAYENGTQLNSTVTVVKSATFGVQLNTNLANLLGSYRDHPSDGDNAILKVDGGVDVSGSGLYTDPSNAVTYGFGQFVTTHAPGYTANNGAGGDGTYAQAIDAAKLGQGYHFITVEAFRHRDDGGPAVYTDWRQTVYVDLAPPNSAAVGFAPVVAGTNENRNLAVTSVDGLANNVHTFLDLPFGLTDAQVLAMVSSGSQANQLDVASWQHAYAGVTSGNHTATVVSYKPDGTTNVQRFTAAAAPFLAVSTINGAGVGDVTFDGVVNAADVTAFATVVQSNNATFNPAADVNGDGLVDLADTFLLGPVLTAHAATAATYAAYNNLTAGAYVRSHAYTVAANSVIYDDTAAATTVNAGVTLTAAWVRGSTLSVAAGGSVKIATTIGLYGAGTSTLTGLTIAGTAGAWTGQVDLGNQDLVLESTAAARSADLARLTSMAAEGYDAGRWDGQGLASTAAMTAANHLYALGVVANDDGRGNPLYTNFGGQPADDHSVLVAYTLYGDANLDGVVNAADYARIDNGFLNHLTGWANGDFNYDGVVDGSDYTLIDNAFNQQSPLAGSTVQVAVPTNELAAVPEPASAASIFLTAAALAGRRRRANDPPKPFVLRRPAHGDPWPARQIPFPRPPGRVRPAAGRTV